MGASKEESNDLFKVARLLDSTKGVKKIVVKVTDFDGHDRPVDNDEGDGIGQINDGATNFFGSRPEQ